MAGDLLAVVVLRAALLVAAAATGILFLLPLALGAVAPGVSGTS